jgi:hypothetical protein
VDAPGRIAAHLPGIRLILLLRDPVDRAYSHYHMAVRNGYEFRNWEDVVDADLKRWRQCPLQPSELSSGQLLSQYLNVSAALPHLKRWLSHFPGQQILVLRTSELEVNLQVTLDRVCAFLDLPVFVRGGGERFNVASYPPMVPEIEQRLREWFAPHERELERFLADQDLVH